MSPATSLLSNTPQPGRHHNSLPQRQRCHGLRLLLGTICKAARSNGWYPLQQLYACTHHLRPTSIFLTIRSRSQTPNSRGPLGGFGARLSALRRRPWRRLRWAIATAVCTAHARRWRRPISGSLMWRRRHPGLLCAARSRRSSPYRLQQCMPEALKRPRPHQYPRGSTVYAAP